MIEIKKIFLKIFLVWILAVVMLACRSVASTEKVVIYTSVDQIFSEPVLEKFEQETGIDVLAVYDVEAAKTTGLVNRLILEKNAPRADVWWNSEIIQTIVLEQAGVLAPYSSPEAKSIASLYRHPKGYWNGLGGRARVIIVNTDRVENPDEITSIYDFLDDRWDPRQIGIANPLFGTSVTHAASLYAYLGPQQGREFYENLAERGIKVLEGNSVVRDQVAIGSLDFGLTDTDDACGAKLRGDPVAIIFPDQDSFGTLVIPGSVAMIAGAPHPDTAKKLIDYLLSARVEQQLVDAEFIHIPIHAGVEINNTCISGTEIQQMEIDFNQVFLYMEDSQAELREIFLR